MAQTLDVLNALKQELISNNDQRIRELLVDAHSSLQYELLRANEATERANEATERARNAEENVERERQRGDHSSALMKEIKDELREIHDYSKRTHRTLTAAVGNAAQVYNALTDSHTKSIINPQRQKLQPGIALVDVSACQSQRDIYGDEWPKLYKMVEGQQGNHVKRKIKELEEEGGVVVRQWGYYANGITHRHNLKGSLDDWLQHEV